MIFQKNVQGNKTLGRFRCRWCDDVKMHRREAGWCDIDWIDLAQDRRSEGFL
jgi:hypothetical protein